jgi:hypothetical protein
MGALREGAMSLARQKNNPFQQRLNGLRYRDRLTLQEAAYFVQDRLNCYWDDAVGVVVDNIRARRLPADIKPSPYSDNEIGHINPARSTVAMADLTAWLDTLPEKAVHPEVVPNAPRWPWGSHETELLRKLAEAAEKFWTLYDPTDNTTAPTNEQVADWLAKQGGVSKRNAEVMASILRADGLPTGPRTPT